MKNNLRPLKSTLLSLKDWVRVAEAADYLQILFGEEVTSADILRLALDGRLTLSVNFVNTAMGRIGKIVPLEEAEWLPPRTHSIFGEPLPAELMGRPILKSLCIDDERYINLEDRVTTIDGIWDLAMIGAERLDIEHYYQQLTGGPEITLTALDGAFVQQGDSVICQLQESFDDNEFVTGSKAQMEKITARISSGDIDDEKAKVLREKYKKCREEYLRNSATSDRSDNYYPAGQLPEDSVLVVRTKALLDLQERLLQEGDKKTPDLDPRSERTYINIIGAMLETFIHKEHGELDFPSEAQLRSFLGEKYIGFKGITERTLAEKFAAAKRSIREELD